MWHYKAYFLYKINAFYIHNISYISKYKLMYYENIAWMRQNIEKLNTILQHIEYECKKKNR